MPDRAEHHVLFIEHRGNARFHRIVRDDQTLDVFGPVWLKLAIERAVAGEILHAAGERLERPRHAAQDQRHGPDEHEIEHDGLTDQRGQHAQLAAFGKDAGREPLPG